MKRKKRQMWVDDDFYKEVKKKCEHGEKNMLDYTKSLTKNMKDGKKKKRY